jgi:flagellar basal body rod protein FlgG
MHISSSGALTSMYRLDTLTNNLANVNTVGFKPQTPYTRQRDVVRVEDNLPYMDSNDLLEQLGAGVQLAPTRVEFTQGSLTSTGNPLDLAIAGEGFLTVKADASGDTAAFHLTRDGRLAINQTGQLVLASSGRPVLDTTGQPIRLDDTADIKFGPDGRVYQNQEEVARLNLVDVPDRTRLSKKGEGMFTLTNDALDNMTTATGQLKQGMVENSAVNEISALMAVQAAASDVRTNLDMIRYHDQLMDRAINRLGRAV